MTLDLADDEARAVAQHLRQAIDAAPYSLAPRLDPVKTILTKLAVSGEYDKMIDRRLK